MHARRTQRSRKYYHIDSNMTVFLLDARMNSFARSEQERNIGIDELLLTSKLLDNQFLF